MRVCTSGSILTQLWRNFWQIIKGHFLKSVKMDEEVCQWKQEYDRPVRIREFQPHWLTMFEWLEYHVTNGVCKICRMYERIWTFITRCRTFKIESIRSHNMSNGHTKTITRMMTITVTTTVNNHSDNLIWSCYSFISFFQSLKVLTINVGTLPSLVACSTQDKKLDNCIKYHFAWNQTQ